MIIYEVNLDVNRKVADDFARWLETHIREMLQFEGFVKAHWYERDQESDAGTICWTTHYQVDSRKLLEDYFENHASDMRADGVNRFGELFTASRRILIPYPGGDL